MFCYFHLLMEFLILFIRLLRNLSIKHLTGNLLLPMSKHLLPLLLAVDTSLLDTIIVKKSKLLTLKLFRNIHMLYYLIILIHSKMNHHLISHCSDRYTRIYYIYIYTKYIHVYTYTYIHISS